LNSSAFLVNKPVSLDWIEIKGKGEPASKREMGSTGKERETSCISYSMERRRSGRRKWNEMRNTSP